MLTRHYVTLYNGYSVVAFRPGEGTRTLTTAETSTLANNYPPYIHPKSGSRDKRTLAYPHLYTRGSLLA